MDDTGFELCGRQLCDLLTAQVAPPPGAEYVLGFLGQAVAVDAESFLSGSEYNPARIAAWLDIVAEPLAAVGTADHHVEAVPWTAYKLMESICAFARSAAPAGSEDEASFGKALSQERERLGGATTVGAAPLDWYDPKRIPEWARCHLVTSQTSSSGTSTGTPPPPPVGKRLWGWRTLPPALLEALAQSAAPPAPTASPVHPAEAAPAHQRLVEEFLELQRRPELSAQVASAATGARAFRVQTAAVATPLLATLRAAPVSHASATIAATAHPFDELRLAVSVPAAAPPPPPAPSPALRRLETLSCRVNMESAIRVSAAIAHAGDQASSSAVESSSLQIDLSYRVVQLSRDPWWSDVLLLLDGWYVPGLHRGAMVGEPKPDTVTGVPVALVLTSDVKVRAGWSVADRASAASSTHLGPWALESAQFSEVDANGLSSLAIPGVQVSACIYRKLPVLPPQDPAATAA